MRPNDGKHIAKGKGVHREVVIDLSLRLSKNLKEAGGKCIVLTLGECTNIWDAQIVQDIQALIPGTYTYEFYAKSDSGDHQIQVFAQETKNYQGVYGPDNQLATNEWTLYTGEVYYDGTIENINRFGIQFGKAGASGAKLWIDDIKFGLKK